MKEFSEAIGSMENKNVISPKYFQVTGKDGTIRDIEWHFTAIGDLLLFLMADLTERNNSVLNAIQAMPHGGVVNVHAFNREQDNQVILEVSDEGSGIPPDIQSRIFDPLLYH